jgi:hypothetical protein
MAKYGTAGGSLFQPLAITKAGATPPSLHFAKKDFFSSDRQTQVIRHGSYVFRQACE